jgi:hypothetical protein
MLTRRKGAKHEAIPEADRREPATYGAKRYHRSSPLAI